jgi:hypothetical protein
MPCLLWKNDFARQTRELILPVSARAGGGCRRLKSSIDFRFDGVFHLRENGAGELVRKTPARRLVKALAGTSRRKLLDSFERMFNCADEVANADAFASVYCSMSR